MIDKKLFSLGNIYILKRRKPVKVNLFELRYDPFDIKFRRVRLKIKNNVMVSTVFLGVCFGDAPFETAVKIGNKDWDVIGRSKTHREALQLHKCVCSQFI